MTRLGSQPFFVAFVLLAFRTSVSAQEIGDWPARVVEIRYRSSADDSLQPALFFSPDISEPHPLLVVLHTWSGDYRQKYSIPHAQWCVEKNWAFIHPNFRGPNKRPEATGSEKVVKDITSAVDYAKANSSVDENRIYLVGTSGGGHAALLMAGRVPEIWAGVSAWVPIADLVAWYEETRKAGRGYADHILASVGGDPTVDQKAREEAVRRSPLTHLENATTLAIDINAGIYDGHTGSVPVSHSLRAFNRLASEEDRISEEEIRYMVENAKVPSGLEYPVHDSLYGDKRVLFRRSSGQARVTLFDGGHEIIFPAALAWLQNQRR